MRDNIEPLVSIILPVYNGEKFLSTSIESCLDQTYKNWELLIIDDGSSDGSADIARSYVEKDHRIKYYPNPENMKLPRTLNRGFSLAKGEYLTWTSDDNYYRAEAIEKMVSVLQKTDAGMVFTACSAIDEKDNFLFLNRAPRDCQHAIWDYNFVGACFLYTRKTYEYLIYNAKFENPLCSRYSHFVFLPLRLEAMQKAARILTGEHDFKSFCSSRGQQLTTVRQIYDLNVSKEGNMVKIRICGNGFLYNMVRIIVGTLIKVGLGVYPPEYVQEILDAKDRTKAGPKVPAKGLTLIGIEYLSEKSMMPGRSDGDF